jgi:hypothetical protein
VHLLVVPKKPDLLAKGIGDAHHRHTRIVNFRQGARGHPTLAFPGTPQATGRTLRRISVKLIS